MSDEQYLDEAVITCMSASPDEALAAVVRKKANLTENRYTFELIVYETKAWKTVLDAYEVKQGQVWWLSKDRLLLWEGKTDYRILEVLKQQEATLLTPAKIEQVLPLDQEHVLFLLREEIPQDPDFFVTEELPFFADGKGYIKSFGTLWSYHSRRRTWKRVLPPTLNVQTVTAAGGKIYFAGHERRSDRVDFLHSAVYRISWKQILLDSLEEPKMPEPVLPDLQYRIDTIQEWDHRLLLAASDMEPYGPIQNPNFYLLEDTGGLTLFAANENSTKHTVVRDWKPATQQFRMGKEGLYFLSTVRGDVCIKLLTKDGEIREELHEAGAVDDFLCFSDGRMLAAGAYSCGFDELYLYENGHRKQLSDFHGSKGLEEAVTKPYHYEFPADGQPVDCFVIPPKNLSTDSLSSDKSPPKSFSDRQCYPAIISIHGGHKMAYGKDVLMIDFQLWADAGYFVIYCNPRGSDGLDNRFADIIGKNAVTDTRDILKALDLALEKWPQIDPKRIGITGGSYGGYLTNWIITQTDRFACAVSVRSISNRISKQMASDTGFRYPLLRLGNSVWEDAGGFWNASPMKYIRQCKTPTLLIHAEGDLRCPIEEAVQMYTALKLNGVPAKLVIFKGESHALTVSGKPQARLKHSREIRKWFDFYLKAKIGENNVK